ncbi:MAG: homocysteine S-methyltransferase family protein [Anaerovoracaceae bacterium]|nr:homocysteine S-methyltransferase family protein [Anaerovoracaceae bacterium]
MKIFSNNRIHLLDGAMGTMLQRHGVEPGAVSEVLNIEQPDVITAIHREYVQAGADVIYTNTFGLNRYKMEKTGYGVAETADAAVKAARAACDKDTKVAIDMGPIGQLLEPMGTLSFEDAYDTFKEVCVQGEKSGADLAVIETMTDLYEVKAALLAVKENTDLPVMVSMTFQEDGRTFTGCGVEEMAALLTRLGADAVGINCSLGPDEIWPIAQRLAAETPAEIFVKPNAGLPDPKTGEYHISAEEFAASMRKYRDLGVSMIGGCCGTDPTYISALRDMLGGAETAERPEKAPARTRVCTATAHTDFDRFVVIGERLNPTGKKRLKDAIVNEDYDYIMEQALKQADEGAGVLDVNAGIPGIDEAAVLPALVKKIQSVTDVPLQIDSGDPAAVEAALRVYNGKPVLNSVNGTEKSLREILPAAARYGAAIIALTLDDDGIPETAEKRIAIAEKIRNAANAAGIPDSDIIVDCLTLTVSAEQAQAAETLKAIRTVTEDLGLKTVLGLSNISFGLPNRPLINRTFLVMAMQQGLSAAIMNPADEEMKGALRAFELLSGADENAAAFIEAFRGWTPAAGGAKAQGHVTGGGEAEGKTAEFGTLGGVTAALKKGLPSEAVRNVEKILESKSEMETVNDYLVPALDVIGKEFEAGTLYLPQMMQAAVAAQAGFEVIKKRLAESGVERVSKGTVIIATVKGDVHDIGKNIVKTILENYGYDVTDLGRDVPPETIVKTAEEKNCRLVGLSALMTTTLGSMEETTSMLKSRLPGCHVMVGGAVVTQDYADSIGADYYCADAMKAAAAANEVFGAQA